MDDLLTKVINSGPWKPIPFTVYNYLEEEELYQNRLEAMGYDIGHDDFECKTLMTDNPTAVSFKDYVENTLQKGKVIIAVCVIGDNDSFTIVKPKSVSLEETLKKN